MTEVILETKGLSEKELAVISVGDWFILDNNMCVKTDNSVDFNGYFNLTRKSLERTINKVTVHEIKKVIVRLEN